MTEGGNHNEWKDKRKNMVYNRIEEKTDWENESEGDVDPHKLLLKCPNLFFMLKEHYMSARTHTHSQKFRQKSVLLDQNKFSLFQIDTHAHTHPMCERPEKSQR